MATVGSLTATLLAGCSTAPDVATRTDSTRSGVGVVAEGCGLTASVGSGAVIDAGSGRSFVATVAHTIKGATSVTVIDVDGDALPARVVAFDKGADLALLDVDGLNVPPIAVTTEPASSVDGATGSILTWGRDEGVEEVPVVIVKRLRVTIEDIYVDEVVERTALEIAGPVTGGDSGGPVLDADGEVIGVVYANSRGRGQVGFATDQRELMKVLASVTGATVDNGTCF